MYNRAFRHMFNIGGLIASIKYKMDFKKEHPHFFNPCGTLVFCGPQGSGKTLSAVDYCTNVLHEYPLAIICTNVELTEYHWNAKLIDRDGGKVLQDFQGNDITPQYIADRVNSGDKAFRVCMEYTGLDCLKYVNNGEYGVLFLIDEFHLELNSLESQNVDIEVMIEISQQRKQRKHIVGTSQVFMRLAKPLREQIKDVVNCHCLFGLFQWNELCDGEKGEEVDGHLKSKVIGHSYFFHAPEMYKRYDTYAKMKRYNKEWNGRKRSDPVGFDLFKKEL